MNKGFFRFNRFRGDVSRGARVLRGANRGAGVLGVAGFTMVELLITLAVLTILASLSIPAFQGWTIAISATRAADELTSNLLLARTRAIALNRCVQITFDTSANSYSLFSYADSQGGCSGGGTLEKTVNMDDLKIRFGCNSGLTKYADGGNSCPGTGTGITFSTNIITFNSQGQANADGYIYLVPLADYNRKNINMKAIEITGLTGRIRRHSCCWD